MSTVNRHKWEPGWDDKSDSAVFRCKTCGNIKRTRQNYLRSSLLIRKSSVTEYFIDGEWKVAEVLECVAKTADSLSDR